MEEKAHDDHSAPQRLRIPREGCHRFRGRTRFKERFGSGGKRLRRIGIVAVARKLLIALWRFLETGVLPEGAVLKEA